METLARFLPDVVMNNLHLQRKTGRYCDVRLTVGKNSTWTHSSVMCSLSPFISRECCIASKTPSIGNYKQYSFNSPLTIKLYKKDSFDCFKCLQNLTDIIYGQKIDFDPLHSSHFFALCKLLSFSDVLVKLIYNRIPRVSSESSKLPDDANDSDAGEERMETGSKSEETVSNNSETDNINTKRKMYNIRTRLTMSNLKVLSGKMHSCISCFYKCYRPSVLLSHLRDTGHGGNVCSLCYGQFDTHEELRKHYAMHDDPKPFFCTVCDQRFQTRGFLNQHLPRHSKETPYTCPFCKKGFKWKYGLNSHLVTHSNEKKFLCDECGYSTIYAKTMRAHKLTHTGELFRCSFPGCVHTCSRKENMKRHLSTHSNDKPFVCEICGSKFTLNKSLKRHALIHSTVGLVNTCPHCPFEALRADNLKAHILRQHGDKHSATDMTDNLINVNVEITDRRRYQDSNMDRDEDNDLSVLADAASSLAKIRDLAC